MKIPMPDEAKAAIKESMFLMKDMDEHIGTMGDKLDRIADLLEELLAEQKRANAGSM